MCEAETNWGFGLGRWASLGFDAGCSSGFALMGEPRLLCGQKALHLSEHSKGHPTVWPASRLPCAPSQKMGEAKTRRKRLKQVRPAYPSFHWVLGGTEGDLIRATG